MQTLTSWWPIALSRNTNMSLKYLRKIDPLRPVLRKIPIDIPTKDIFDDLIDLEFPVTEVSQMYGQDKASRKKIPHPLKIEAESSNLQSQISVEL